MKYLQERSSFGHLPSFRKQLFIARPVIVRRTRTQWRERQCGAWKSEYLGGWGKSSDVQCNLVDIGSLEASEIIVIMVVWSYEYQDCLCLKSIMWHLTRQTLLFLSIKNVNRLSVMTRPIDSLSILQLFCLTANSIKCSCLQLVVCSKRPGRPRKWWVT